jgi:putative transposase
VIAQEAKYRAIYHYRKKYPVVDMCRFLEVSRSAYYDWIRRKDQPSRDAELTELIREGYNQSRRTYGYRRITIWLRRKHGLLVNQKAVRRIMRKNDMPSIIRRKRKYKFNSAVYHRYDNVLARDFKASKPNEKWVTDITYIHTGQGTMYLSVIKDLYDNSIVSYKIDPNMYLKLVLDTIKGAVEREKVAGGLTLHSDQGFQYTSHAYFALTEQYGIKQSMSRRGNCWDNACCENFFGHLKEECIRLCKLQTFKEARDVIADYIDFYNNQRIQLKTELTPLEKRHQFCA